MEMRNSLPDIDEEVLVGEEEGETVGGEEEGEAVGGEEEGEDFEDDELDRYPSPDHDTLNPNSPLRASGNILAREMI